MLIMVSAPLSLIKNWIEKQCSTMARFNDCLPLPRPVWLDPYRVSSTDVSSHSTLGLHIPLLSLWVYRMLLTIHNAAFLKQFNWKPIIYLSSWPTGLMHSRFMICETEVRFPLITILHGSYWVHCQPNIQTTKTGDRISHRSGRERSGRLGTTIAHTLLQEDGCGWVPATFRLNKLNWK